ncbi:MAG: hypothetical protein K2Q26_05080 [Bdellovibrionales bacterium]|nr:hypothetical protein [Bdellovibrionales bacterium]
MTLTQLIKIPLVLGLLSATTLALAQIRPYDPNPSDLTALSRQGDLFSVRLVPGSPLKIFVFGREEAELDLSNVKINGTYDLSGVSLRLEKINPKRKVLKITRREKHFEAQNFGEVNPVVLELTISSKKKSEKFIFEVKTPPMP